ncbi:uncharacterized protein F4812DRAFT_457243 [Daldinia caldariorum]|uniref:uncharacterized protein n=1 Tax=Daldinia caldariorum TaxID=326644 RepID=UPI0020087923|nr:uncharacterized protein F4812DRAFT_457243 [Daldinia caldariorum]KAI1469840.1 hypothetical protein F4812DRAFT_457243 [Daldinia caldariorum]
MIPRRFLHLSFEDILSTPSNISKYVTKPPPLPPYSRPSLSSRAALLQYVLEIIVEEIDKRDVIGDGEDNFAVEAKVQFNNELYNRGKYCMDVSKGVPENVVEKCCNALRGAHIKVTGKTPKSGLEGEGEVSAAPWFDGVGSVPFACGDDCLQYADLTHDEYTQMRKAFLNKAYK